MFERPAFFTTCVFGLTFILLANVATNSIAFATCVLDASGQSGLKNHDAIVRAIAVAVAAATCLIHGTWRQGGIYLNNLLAAVKIAILLLIFILAMLAYGGVFKRPADAVSNLAISQTFKGGTTDPHAMADSFLSILFAFGGFNQANYVIGEVDDPRRRYKWPAFSAVAIVSLLYIIVNVAYFVVVPTDEFSSGLSNNVAHSLFKVTLGSLSDDWLIRAPRMLSALMAVSALGNIIVMTYTAARVKQEIAKEGILPLRRFLAGSVPSFRIPIRKLWGSNLETLPEDVPLGALVLHFTLSTVLILATWSLTTLTTYSLLVDLYSYSIDAIFGTAIGFGLLYMRFLSGRRWSEHSKASGFRVLPIVSFFSALIFGTANLYPVAAKWVPPTSTLSLPVPWFTVAAVGWSILLFGVFWWIGFRFVIPHLGRTHAGRQLLITRKLWFHQEHGYKVLEYEDIDFRWVLREDENDGENMMERTFFAEEHEVTARMQGDGQYALRN
jgi:amino acid transporter